MTAAGVRISELPAANAANDVDQIEVNQSGVTRRVTLSQIGSFIGSGGFVSSGATVNFDDLMIGSDTEDPMAQLQAAFSSGELENQHVVFGTTGRRYIFRARPTTGLGSNGQYLTPPQRCTLEWRTEFDFSAWPDAGAPNIFRRQGSYGSTRAVVGSVAKGASTIPLASGQAAGLAYGQRVLLRTTTAQTTLVGAWSLVDAYNTGFAARAEDLIVQGVSGDSVTFLGAVQDDYDSTATPVLQTYENEPAIRLINPLAVGPGFGDRFFNVMLGRGFRVDGGTIRNLGLALRCLAVMGGEIAGLDTHCYPGGGAYYIGDATSNLVVRNCRSFGGGQPFGLSGSGAFWGITRDVTWRDCISNHAGNGFSMHNLHERISYIDCTVNDATGAAFDIRSPNCRIVGGSVRRCAGSAVLARISPNGLTVDGLQVDGALSGIVLEDSGSPPYDYIPDNLTVQNCGLRNIGGTGGSGAISFVYSQLHGGVRPALGKLRLANNYATMNDNTAAYRIGGKWRSPQVVDCEADAASGASPTGAALVIFEGVGGTVGDAASDVVISGFRQSPTFALPLISNTTGLPFQLAASQQGATTTDQQVIAASATLTTAHMAQGYNNTGAAAMVVLTLPGAARGRKFGPFYVSNANGFRLQATSSDTFRIGSAVTGAANGTITGTVIGAWVEIEGVSSSSWIARVDAAANWTVA